MATRAIKPKRDEGPMGRWESLPERAPSLIRTDKPLIVRTVAFAALVLVAVGGLAMATPTWEMRYPIGPNWGFFWFTLGVGGLLFHAYSDRDLQYRRAYAMLGLVLVFTGIVLRAFPGRGGMGVLFLPFGSPCLVLGLMFLLGILRHESDEFWRTFILRLIGIVGAVMALAGFFFGNVIADFLTGEGVILILLGLVYLAGFIAMQEPGSPVTFRAGLAIGAAGLIVFAVALFRSLRPALLSLSADQSYLVPDGLLLMGLGLVWFLFALGTCSDRVLIVLTRRELSAFFYSPIAYLVILGLSLIGWFMYASFVDRLRRPMIEPIVAHYVLHFIPVACLIFVVPVLTMRLLSEEKRSGTLEVLLTAPVDEISVVLSKFFACLIFFLLALAPWGLYLVALRVIGTEPFDYRPMLSFFLALAFSGAGFLAMGLFFSSITRNQIISAVLTFATIMGFTIVFWFAHFPAPWGDILSYVSYLELWLAALDGHFAPRYLLFHLSVTIFFLFLTTKVLEARKWT